MMLFFFVKITTAQFNDYEQNIPKSVKVDQPWTNNPNMGALDQGKVENVLQGPLRIQGLPFFFLFGSSGTDFLVHKKK